MRAPHCLFSRRSSAKFSYMSATAAVPPGSESKTTAFASRISDGRRASAFASRRIDCGDVIGLATTACRRVRSASHRGLALRDHDLHILTTAIRTNHVERHLFPYFRGCD